MPRGARNAKGYGSNCVLVIGSDERSGQLDRTIVTAELHERAR